MKKLCLLLLALCLALPAMAQQVPSLRQPFDADLAAGVYDSYFDDAVFVGDSLTHQLHSLVLDTRKESGQMLGEARFLHATSYTLQMAARTTPGTRVTFKYRGRPVSLRDGMVQMEAGKVFLMLGINDHAGNLLERDMQNYETIIDLLQEAIPGVVFVAMSVTPVTKANHGGVFNQRNINAFNNALRELAKRKEVHYIDVATMLMNDEGFLNVNLTRDKKVHLSREGLGMVVNSLRRFAREQYEQGHWQLEVEHLAP